MRSLLLTILLFSLMGGSVLAQDPVDVSIVINGKALDGDPPPRLVGESIYIPMRKVFTALGAQVRSENSVIIAQRGRLMMSFRPNVSVANVDGKEIELEEAPLLLAGTVYVPLRFVAQALGDSVAYDGNTKTVTVVPGAAAAAPEISVPQERIALLKTGLTQLVVGNQGAILKVRDASGDKEVYYRGLDDRDTAPYSDKDHDGIVGACGVQNDLKGWVKDTIEAFTVLPKRQAIAFLGMVYSIPSSSVKDPGPAVDDAIEEFLISVVKENKSVVLRRQAVLSMAVGDQEDLEVLEAVLSLYETSENLWETFPVQQYFQYHADDLRKLPNFPAIRARVAAVNSLYTANILQYLDGQ